jgi:carboxyl-terminal processing protease
MRRRALGAFLVIVAGLIALPSPQQGKAEAAGTDTSKHFELFSDVLAKVRANYIVKPDDSKLLEDAIKGVLTELDQTRGGPMALPLPRQGKTVAFGDVLAQIRANYPVRTDNSKLVEYAIKGAVSGLDPHSTYLSPKEVEEEQDEARGGFGGLGVNVRMESGGAKVIEPLDTMPAERAGVLAGDAITAIDGRSLKGLSMSAAGEKMRGPVGSAVTLTLARNGVATPITVKVVRDIIRVNPVQYSVEGDVGWIKVKSFEHRYTADRVRWAVEDIKKVLGSKVSGYVLDLRNNPGGLLDQAIAVADAFLDGGSIVMTKGRNASDSQRADAKAGDITDGKLLVVLINGGSASASEVVAGALQDNNRATLLGTRSYGKGSVQTLIPLVNRGAIRLTTATYYTPSGRSIQATGIEPDYDLKPEIPQSLKLELASLPFESEAQLRGHLKNHGTQERTGSGTYVPKEKAMDDQLNAAIALIHALLPDADQNADGSGSGSSRS